MLLMDFSRLGMAQAARGDAPHYLRNYASDCQSLARPAPLDACPIGGAVLVTGSSVLFPNAIQLFTSKF